MTGTTAASGHDRHRFAEAPLASGPARERPVVRVSRAVVTLALTMAVLAAAASLAGLSWPGGAGPSTYATPRGDEVQLYGRGLHALDSVFTGANNRAMDVVILAFGVPLLVGSALGYRRAGPGAGVILTGVTAYVLYAYASMSLITAFNGLFLIYVALFSASLFSLILPFRSIDLDALPAAVRSRRPRRRLRAPSGRSTFCNASLWAARGTP